MNGSVVYTHFGKKAVDGCFFCEDFAPYLQSFTESKPDLIQLLKHHSSSYVYIYSPLTDPNNKFHIKQTYQSQLFSCGWVVQEALGGFLVTYTKTNLETSKNNHPNVPVVPMNRTGLKR